MAVDAARAKSVFLAASDLDDPVMRSEYLDRECGSHADLRARVEALLRANDAAPIKVPDAATVDSADGQPDRQDYADPTARVGALLAGKYKLIEKIGEGGMGSVFMAQQTEPVKRAVALKVVKAGMDSKAVLARFEAERQAVAMMDHPNIAKVFDAGTTDSGRPFFAMELVKGTPITRYCDDHKLSPRERLELFVPVCQAIQHAHQKGVIHRDIKPSNVLVAMYDDQPVPKVIDFGVAKAAGQSLTDRTLMTGFGALVGTPEYMSPEQASLNNLDIDTRSDVYSLGVMLYELLTGTTPVDRKSLGQAALMEILRIVREEEAPRPSTKLSTSDTLPSVAANRGTEPVKLSKLMKGELDWLVLKALEKDRSRRYESAASFAADVQRYLNGEPVQAVPPSLGYRLSTAYRKNRVAVLTIGAFVAVLLLTTGISIQFGLAAKQAEGVAEQRQRDAEQNESKAVRAGEQLQAARDELWTSLYASRTALIRPAWEANRYERVRELLAAQMPSGGQRDLRGFEWHYLDRQINGDLRSVRVPPNDCNFAPLSPDGTRLLRFTSNGDELLLRSFDTSTGREQFAIRYPSDWGYGAWYSPDGKWIVSTVQEKLEPRTIYDKGNLRRWDAATGVEDVKARGIVAGIMPLGGPDAMPAIWHEMPTEKTPATYKCWVGKEIKTIEQPWPGLSDVVALSPDGILLAVSRPADNNKVFLEMIDTRTGKLQAQHGAPTITLRGFELSPRDAAIAFTADSKRLAVAGDNLQVWELMPRRLVVANNHPASKPVFSPDGTRLAYISGPDAMIVDAATGQVRRVIKGHDGGIESVAFTRDGTVLVTAGNEWVKHWDATLDERVPVIPERRDEIRIRPEFSSPSPDGRFAGRFEDPELKVWGLTENSLVVHKMLPPAQRVLPSAPEHTWLPGRCIFSPDSRRVAGAHSTSYGDRQDAWICSLRLWDLDAGRQVMAIERAGAMSQWEFSPDGRLLAAVVHPPGEVMVWDTTAGKHRYTVKLPDGISPAIAFSTDGSRMGAVARERGSLAVRFWDPDTGVEISSTKISFAVEKSRAVTGYVPPAIGPHGKRIAAFANGEFSVWSAESNGRRVELKGAKGLDPNTSRMAFSPDGTRLATASQRGEIKVWDPETGTELLSLRIPAEIVHHLTFTPDGQKIRIVMKTDVGFETRLLDGSPRSRTKQP
jgi:serine/threonine protein kinase/WD40 repeat protein